MKNELVEKHMQHMAFIKKMDDERNTVHQPSKGNMGNSPKMGPIPLHWDEDGAIYQSGLKYWGLQSCSPHLAVIKDVDRGAGQSKRTSQM